MKKDVEQRRSQYLKGGELEKGQEKMEREDSNEEKMEKEDSDEEKMEKIFDQE